MKWKRTIGYIFVKIDNAMVICIYSLFVYLSLFNNYEQQ